MDSTSPKGIGAVGLISERKGSKSLWDIIFLRSTGPDEIAEYSGCRLI